VNRRHVAQRRNAEGARGVPCLRCDARTASEGNTFIERSVACVVPPNVLDGLNATEQAARRYDVALSD
jgi:hypothetical protein